jgi:hypothetical protein
LDIVSVDFVGRGLADILWRSDSKRSVIHLSLGDHAPPLEEVLQFLMGWIGKKEEPKPPAVVDLATYRLFKNLISQTGDALFTRIYQTADAFLSSLLYPKVFNTSLAESVRRLEWRNLCRKVFEYQLKHEYRRISRKVSDLSKRASSGTARKATHHDAIESGGRSGQGRIAAVDCNIQRGANGVAPSSRCGTDRPYYG